MSFMHNYIHNAHTYTLFRACVSLAPPLNTLVRAKTEDPFAHVLQLHGNHWHVCIVCVFVTVLPAVLPRWSG